MNVIHCISTMDQSYYNGIGKLMIHSWKQCFPHNYRLHLYLENFSITDPDTRIIIEDWNEVEVLFKIWKSRGFEVRRKQPGFVKKALTQIVAFKKLTNEKIIWLDADVISLKELPENFFEKVIESYPLAVWDWNNQGFETGTIFVDTSHELWKQTIKIYSDLYVSDRVHEDNTRWFDGEVLEISVKESGIPYKNLFKLITKKSKVPINRSWLGEYLRHFMAQYKDRLEYELKDCGREDLIKLLKEDINE